MQSLRHSDHPPTILPAATGSDATSSTQDNARWRSIRHLATIIRDYSRMRVFAILLLFALPAHADHLTGTWHGPRVIHLLSNGAWVSGLKHGGWWYDRKILFLQRHMPPMFSYRPPAVPCQYGLTGAQLVLRECEFVGVYRR